MYARHDGRLRVAKRGIAVLFLFVLNREVVGFTSIKTTRYLRIHSSAH